MDNSELHYMTYDPDEIWHEMHVAYVNSGGDILYPGDEKEMLLRSVQAILVQAFAGVDNALRMATLRYAIGDYLDLYGQRRDCYRIKAIAAEGEVEITFGETGKPKTIKAGTGITADGIMLYELMDDIIYSGSAQTVRVGIVCSETGSGGNGLREGTQMQFASTEESVRKIVVTKSASGGMEAEDDETYRARIQEYGLGNVTTGPSGQYESKSRGVSGEIIDAHAKRTADGEVGIYLILAPKADAEAIKASVLAAVNPNGVRPLTDKVNVYEAEKITYTLKAEYSVDDASATDVAAAADQAVKDYQAWQDHTIGRAFNPDRLIAMLYQAGASRVRWGAESKFNGGAVQYTEINDDQCCSGSIETAVIEE